MDFSLKKNNFFLLLAEKLWWSQFMKMLVFFNSKKMDGSKIFCKKSWKNGFKTKVLPQCHFLYGRYCSLS